LGPIDGPATWTLQQSMPGMQHSTLQQNSPAAQAICMLQTASGSVQIPLSQNGWAPVHCLPHVPQLLMSFCSLTQVLLQHAVPAMQSLVHVVPLELDELAAVEVDVVLPVEVDAVPAVELDVVPAPAPLALVPVETCAPLPAVAWSPPAPLDPLPTVLPQPKSASTVPIVAKKGRFMR
jgi:hypothetical protein